MKGYVAKKGNRWYAVIYEGIDAVTGRERRSWHPAGTDRADAKRLAARLAQDPDCCIPPTAGRASRRRPSMRSTS
ncbi:MAG: hypothetical protein ACRD29_01175 [Acidimicrobiales bacterium]